MADAMREYVLRRLGDVSYDVDTHLWSIGCGKTLTNNKMRMRVIRMFKNAPGPFVIHTEAKRQAKSLLDELKEKSGIAPTIPDWKVIREETRNERKF